MRAFSKIPLFVVTLFLVLCLHASYSKSILKPPGLAKSPYKGISFNPQVDVASIPAKEDAGSYAPAESILQEGKMPLKPPAAPSQSDQLPHMPNFSEQQDRRPVVVRPSPMGSNSQQNIGSFEQGGGHFPPGQFQGGRPSMLSHSGKYPPNLGGSSSEIVAHRPYASGQLHGIRPRPPGHGGRRPSSFGVSSSEVGRYQPGLYQGGRPSMFGHTGRYPSSLGGSSSEITAYRPHAPVQLQGSRPPPPGHKGRYPSSSGGSSSQLGRYQPGSYHGGRPYTPGQSSAYSSSQEFTRYPLARPSAGNGNFHSGERPGPFKHFGFGQSHLIDGRA
uniref:Uncharacterized protein n=1 Tax=Trichuris muris TaxID=70415 RepID=A0A5S6QGH6_TRIMR